MNEYVKHMEKINTECLKSDNIFRYYDLQKYKRLEEEILAGDYINGRRRLGKMKIHIIVMLLRDMKNFCPICVMKTFWPNLTG